MQTSTVPVSIKPFVKGAQELAQAQKIANDLESRLKNGNFWGINELEAILLNSLEKLGELKKNIS